MFVRNSYVCRTPGGSMTRGTGRRGRKIYRNWFLIKSTKYGTGVLGMNIIFPPEYVGKKIRLKVEVIEDDV